MSVQVAPFERSALKVPKVADQLEAIIGDGFEVNGFVEHFAVLAGAEGGIKHLRGLIIDLAIRGRLGTQNASDAGAHLLLRAAGRALDSDRKRRVLERRSEPTYSLPGGWAWCEPQDLGEVSPRNRADDDLTVAFVPMTNVPTDYRQSVTFEPRPWREIKKGYTHVADGDIAVAKITPCFQNQKSCVMTGLPSGIGAATTELMILRPVPGVVEPKYVLLFFKSPEFVTSGTGLMSGTAGQQRVPVEYFAAVPMPLPPLVEQKRIVAKVDQLMALCDELEARQTKKRETGTRLTKSALEALTSADGPEEFDTAWKRVVENFDVLIDRADKVGALRAIVLDLAIRGRFGLSQTAQRRQDGAPFALPEEWRWMLLGDLCERITKGSSPKWQGISYVETARDGILFVTSENVGSGRLLLERPKYVETRFNDIEPRSTLRRGDLLMNIVGASIGRVAVFDRDDVANVNQAVCIIRLKDVDEIVDRGFMLLFLNSPTCISYMFDKQVDNARANLSMGNISKFRVPLPPIAEQRAIVAKVDRLMRVSDELEPRLRRAEDQAAKLVEAVVQELVA